jgi:hypothetical protein
MWLAQARREKKRKFPRQHVHSALQIFKENKQVIKRGCRITGNVCKEVETDTGKADIY